jgi:uncharacterized protein YtpQ (UPF0354 family)
MFGSFFPQFSGFSESEFRERVLKLSRSLHPEVHFEPAEEEGVIAANGIRMGLQNVKAKFELSDRSEGALKQILAEHLVVVLSAESPMPGFETARQRLRPQLMPPEYAEKMPVIAFPFGETLAVGIVLDTKRSYAYLRHEDAVRWGKSHDDLLEISIGNLDAASRNIQMEFMSDQGTKWVGIETKDGFDAARILIPKFRKFLIAQLGEPFRVGVPNRDFLICWNRAASAEFANSVSSQIREDFRRQPYPLSPQVFEVDSDGNVAEMV